MSRGDDESSLVSRSPFTQSLHTTTEAASTSRTSSTTTKGRHHLLAGSAGGLIASASLQPFDVLKTRIQQGRSDPSGRVVVVAASQHGKSGGSGSSLMSVIQQTIGRGRDRQFSRLWRGTLPSVLRSSLGSGLYFFTLAEMRAALSSSSSSSALGTLSSSKPGSLGGAANGHGLSGGMNLVTGATARATVGFVMMPITLIKVRTESSLFAYASMQHAAREIYAAHGARGFFYGWGATAIRDAPYAGLYVTVYEWSKAQLSQLIVARRRGREDANHEPETRKHDEDGRVQRRGLIGQGETWSINFASGLTAGSAATLLTNPFDVMRTRMQLRPNIYPNFWTAAAKLYAQEGLRTFLDGVGLRIARKSISSAFTWSLYEFVLANL